MTPLTVRAHMAGGIAHAAPWGIALDGLLAAELWAETKAARIAAGDPPPSLAETTDPEDLDLPLARCTLSSTTDAAGEVDATTSSTSAGLWHWAATCAHPEGRPAGLPPEVRHWSGRTDHRAAEQLTPHLPATLSERQGRYRARRMPLLVTTCRALTWQAVGDPDRIRDLLSGITAIGKKRSQGEGHVLHWEITASETDPWSAAHLHPDGTLGRPTPTPCLTSPTARPAPDGSDDPVLELVDGGTGTAGLRPPYMHPARQHTLHLPVPLEDS